MSQPHQLYVLHAVTPLHVGVEDSLGGIDLPTMKERHTGYPLVPGSAVKGVLRAEATEDIKTKPQEAMAAFGPDSGASGDYRGGLVFTDALLLALPVRSLCGTFAWVTCSQLLRRLRRDLALSRPGLQLPQVSSSRIDQGRVPARKNSSPPGSEPEPGAGDAAGGTTPEPDSALLVGGQPQVFLEESVLGVQPDPDLTDLGEEIAGWFWPQDSEAQEFFRERLLVVHDDLFSFLNRLALEVRARVKIDQERGTAADSGPWTEEHMPAETLLYGLVMGRRTVYRERKEEKPAAGEGEQATGAPVSGEASAPLVEQADGAAPAPAAEEKRVKRSAEDSLRYLAGLAKDLPLLRFGGHSTIGLGRAHFRLVTAANGTQPGKAEETTEGDQP